MIETKDTDDYIHITGNTNIHFIKSKLNKNSSDCVYYPISVMHTWPNNQNKFNKSNNFVSNIQQSPTLNNNNNNNNNERISRAPFHVKHTQLR